MCTRSIQLRIAVGAACLLAAVVCPAQPIVKTVAGGGPSLIPSQGVSALSIGMGSLYRAAMATDSAGNVYVASATAVLRLSPAGTATPVAGNGTVGFSSGGGVAVNAEFGEILSLAVSGNSLFISDYGNSCIWQVSLTSGTIAVFAGTPSVQSVSSAGSNGDGGPAVQAGLPGVSSIAADSQGDLYVFTSAGIRKVNIVSGIISSPVLTGSARNAGFGNLDNFFALAVDPTGSTLYSSVGSLIDGGVYLYVLNLCTSALTYKTLPTGALAVDQQGNVYVASGNGIMEVPGGTGTPVQIVATSHSVEALAVDSSNNLYYDADGIIWKTNTSGAAPVQFAGDGSWSFTGDGAALGVTISPGASGLAADQSGNVYFSDTWNNRVRKIQLATGTVTTVAGVSAAGYSGDGQQATAAQLYQPGCLSLDVVGQILYITDTGNNAVRAVNLKTGIINTVVTTNTISGYDPTCAAADGLGNLYVSENDFDFPAIFKVALSSGSVSVFSSNANLVSYIAALVADGAGNVYFAALCQVGESNGSKTTVLAGANKCGDYGDGGPAKTAGLWNASGLALDGQGHLLVSDSTSKRVRSIQLTANPPTISAVTSDAASSTELAYYSGEGGPLACAQLDQPGALAADGNGNIFIFDGDNRLLEGVNWLGALSTVSVTIGVFPAGDGLGFSIDGNGLTAAQNENWSIGAGHTLTAAASQTGQDGYSYSFAGWSDGNPAASRPASASCTANFTALYTPPACSIQPSSTSVSVTDIAGTAEFFLDAPGPECSWSAQSNASWITFSTPPSGTGSGYLLLNIAGNSITSNRSGTISVAGQTLTVTQAASGGCLYQLGTQQALVSAAASNGSVGLNAIGYSGCGTGNFTSWQAMSQASWLQVTSGSPGNGGSGTVGYSIGQNTLTTARTGTILIAGLTYTVTQEGAGATLALSPASASAPASGGLESLQITELDKACDAWTAVSNQPWITITSGASGSGSGVVTYSVDANPGAARNGTLTVAGSAYTINQAGGGSCTFSVAAASASAPAGGGTGSFGMTASGPLCSWSAVSSASWLTVTSAQTGIGSTTVGYSAAATSTSRSATVTIAGQTFTVTQNVGYPVTFQTTPTGLQVMVDGSVAGSSPVTLTGNHSISVASPQSGPAGTQYVFTNWSDGNTSNPRAIDVTAAATYTANFQTQYQLTISASPAVGGTVTPPAGGYYNSGANVPLAATAASGYQFTNWTGSVAASANASTTVTMSAPETVTANFVAATAITIQTSPTGLQFSVDGGAAQAAPVTLELAPGQHTIAVQATQTGAAGAGTQYVFASWSDSGAASHTITVGSSPATYTATFTTQYQLTVAASPAAGGTVTPSSGGFYNSGTSVPISATANPGYQFSGWSGPAAGGTSASTTVTMSAPETVTANFASLTGITIQTSPAGLQFSVDGGAAMAAPQTLNLAPGSHTIGVAVTQAGTTGMQYVFASWSDFGAASHSISVGSSAAVYTATFTTQYQLTVSALPASGGIVTPVTGAFYNAGTNVPITAAAAGGYTFAGWTGSVASSTSASTTVTMSAPETVTANFSSLSGITIETSPPGLQFTVDGGATQTAPQTLNLTAGSHTIAVSATQAGGAGTQYVFSAWNDSGAASHTITVGSTSATYVATFQTQYRLTISASPAADGTVAPSSGGFYTAGTSVPIAATAASGFQFFSWTGSVASSTSASTTVAMSAPETVTANFTALATTAGLGFYPVTPCRVLDTRAGQGFTGQFGPPSMTANQTRSFTIPSSGCNIPATAQAYSLNVTAVPAGGLGYLTIWPAGQTQPVVSTLNSLNGAILANAAIVPAGSDGAVNVFVSNATDLIIDINGYFATPTATALAFYPVTPCRVADTRNGSGPFGGPSLGAGGTRSFTVPSSTCGIPTTAQAYSLNTTVVPPGPLTYLTVWPTGQTQPYVSTLNALQGQIAANAAIVPAGTNGAVSVFVSDPSNVIIDINGYFAPPGTGALYFYPLTPCRIADTRNGTGALGGPSLGAGASRTFPIPSSSCAVPTAAQAYSLNMTAVPPGPLLYLSAWPAGQTQPVVSTLNDLQGQIVANAAIVPAGTSGGISVFVSDPTNLVIDINGYFGQ